MNQPSELDNVLARLQLPAPASLVPWLRKLIEHPGSCVIIAIEQPGDPDGPRVTRAWLSSRERFAVRKALLAVNVRREKKSEALTTEVPADESPDDEQPSKPESLYDTREEKEQAYCREKDDSPYT